MQAEHGDMTTQSRTLNVGVVGLGLAAAGVIPAMVAMPQVNLVAGADINPRALQVFKEKYGAKTYASIEALCDDPDIDAVWIATPNPCHCSHVMLAASARLMAIGFSTMTCLPRSAARITCGQWNVLGVAIQTVSMSGSSHNASMEA